MKRLRSIHLPSRRCGISRANRPGPLIEARNGFGGDGLGDLLSPGRIGPGLIEARPDFSSTVFVPFDLPGESARASLKPLAANRDLHGPRSLRLRTHSVRRWPAGWAVTWVPRSSVGSMGNQRFRVARVVRLSNSVYIRGWAGVFGVPEGPRRLCRPGCGWQGRPLMPPEGCAAV